MSDTTLTLCISGTDCWPDHALISRPAEEINTYNQRSGYIPSRLHELLSAFPGSSFSVPGCGAPYQAYRTTLKVDCWSQYIDPTYGGDPEPVVGSPPKSSLDPLSGYSVNLLAAHAMALIVGTRTQVLGDGLTQEELGMDPNPKGAMVAEKLGLKGADERPRPIEGSLRLCWRPDDLATLGDNPRRLEQVNLVGHSRGGVIAIAVANLIDLYLPHIKVNLIALDPVPGTGNWPENMCTLPGAVLNHYLGIYAVDETSIGFNGVVPRVYEGGQGGLLNSGGAGNVGNNGNNGNPLSPDGPKNDYWDPLTEPDQPGQGPLGDRYQLIFSRGRHATIPGSRMRDGADYTEANIDEAVGAVGELVFYLCLHQLQQWGAGTALAGPADQTISQLKLTIDKHSDTFYTMRNTTYTSSGSLFGTGFTEARGISSTAGRNPLNWSYLEVYLPEGTTEEQGFSGKLNPTATPHATWQALTALPDTAFGGH